MGETNQLSPDRWRQIEELYHSALERSEADRAKFLCDACSGDESLRLQVERLLAHEKEARSFLEQAALADSGTVITGSAAAAAEPETPALAAGAQWLRYRILSRVGAGGM